MGAYTLRRLLQSIVTLWAASTVAFALTFLSGDPASLMIGDHWTAEQIAGFRQYMGFDRPFLVQYAEYLARVAHGDFGRSVRQQAPVTELILQRLPATAALAGAAMLIIVVVAVPAGIISALRRNTWLDGVVMGGTILAQSLPTFWLGMLLILVFGVGLRWLPVSGTGGLSHLILPAITLSAFSTARNARMVRSSMLEILGLDYLRTARAKGLRERSVVWGHALRNALVPVITLLGLEVGGLLAGALVTETVFSWPGIGRLTVDSIYARDYPVVQGVVTFSALVFVVVNLIVDISYGLLDPRIRHA